MKLIRNTFLTAALATIAISMISADAETFITVDEFRTGSINGNALHAFETNAVLGLQFNLGYVVVPGQIQMMDSANQISDLLIFTNTSLFFQSDSRNGFTAPADVASFSFDSSPIVLIN